jgi:uncharacterized protein
VGWQFAAAEFVGGAIMITLLALLLPRIIPIAMVTEARARLTVDAADHDSGPTTLRQRLGQPARWTAAAGYTIADLKMLRREIVIGFVVAGFLAVGVPAGVWSAVFWHGHGALTTVENVIVAPFVAVISFVCSIGNVPLAAALWKQGISFGGVIAFVFADLISAPLLLIYRKLYGGRLTLRLVAGLWLAMSVSGLLTELIFRALDGIPHHRPHLIAPERFSWDHTTVLNIGFLVLFAGLLWIHRHRDRFGSEQTFAHDPVCGMQVERANPGAMAEVDGVPTYFCSEHCRDRRLLGSYA